MIDTITLSIPQEKFEILDYDAFNPTAKGLYEPPFYKLSKGSISCVQNPSKSELQNGVYKPKLTLSKRIINGGFSICLKIEFSIPKLLYGNNFNEIEENNFEEIIYLLQKTLLQMRINISLQALVYAKVVGIHYSKNFHLKNASSSLVISKIGRLNISKRLDSSNTDFRNEGQSVHFHTNSYDLTFYDKVKDLEQSRISDKRAVENDNAIQLDLLCDKLSSKEILRMEVRLNTSKKIKAILKKCQIEKDELIFFELFDKEISKKVLNHFWDEYIEQSLGSLLLCEETVIELFYKIEKNCSKKIALQLLGAIKVIECEGFRTLKSLLPSHTYQRIKSELAKIDSDESYLYNVFKGIKTDLKAMNSLKIEDIEAIDLGEI